MTTTTGRSTPVDGFTVEYDLHEPTAPAGGGQPPVVVLLHGWPGERADYRHVVPLLTGCRVVVPDLRGFGGSDRHLLPPPEAYSAQAQVRSVLGLLDELGVESAVLAGYDVGSRLVQTVLTTAPERVRAAVATPPMPGAGTRILEPGAAAEFWYQHLHRLPLAEDLFDGRPDAVRAYLGHIWRHWSGPGYTVSDADLDRTVALYSRPGAFTASVGWYRAGSGAVARAQVERPPAPADRVAVPLHVLWPAHDPLFAPAWSDRLGEWFADVTLTDLPACGHFVPLEAPEAFAAAVLGAAGS